MARAYICGVRDISAIRLYALKWRSGDWIGRLFHVWNLYRGQSHMSDPGVLDCAKTVLSISSVKFGYGDRTVTVLYSISSVARHYKFGEKMWFVQCEINRKFQLYKLTVMMEYTYPYYPNTLAARSWSSLNERTESRDRACGVGPVMSWGVMINTLPFVRIYQFREFGVAVIFCDLVINAKSQIR